MRDPGASARPLRRRSDDDAAAASPTAPVNQPGQGGFWSNADVQPQAPVREGLHGKAPPDADVAEARPDNKTSPGVDPAKSMGELHEEARNAGIEGRSAMSEEQLDEGPREHRATRSRHAPATRQAPRPGRPPLTGRQLRSDGRPTLGEVDSAEAVRPAADARRPEQCAIVYDGSRRHGEFQVVVTETGGALRCVARSPAFRAPRFGPVRRWGRARVAHELLVLRLEACGWWPVESGGPWHDLAFVRLRVEGMRSKPALVTAVREAGRARFMAEELDDYGNPTPLALSTLVSRAPLPTGPAVGAGEGRAWAARQAHGVGWLEGRCRRRARLVRNLLVSAGEQEPGAPRSVISRRPGRCGPP